MIDVNKINGDEIISFLNELENNEDLCDISISLGSFIFESQEINKGTYELSFSGNYNKGTEQLITDNILHISKDSIWFSLRETFDDDGTDETLVELLSPWVRKHKFKENNKEHIKNIFKEVYDKLPELSFNDKEGLKILINLLIKAKTYMK